MSVRQFPSGATLLALAGSTVVAYIALPVVMLLLNLSGSGAFSVLADSATRDAIQISLLSATAATVVVCLCGVPLAYILATYRFPGRGLVTGLIYLPLVLPPIVGGILLLLVWGPNGAVGHLFDAHGIDFVDHISGIVLAQVFVAAPFLVVAARSAFETIEPELAEMARTLGAGTLRIFWSVSLPLALRSILAGAALSWMRALGEFGATVIMAYHPYALPVYTWVQFSSVGLTPTLPLVLVALLVGATGIALVALGQHVRPQPR